MFSVLTPSESILNFSDSDKNSSTFYEIYWIRAELKMNFSEKAVIQNKNHKSLNNSKEKKKLIAIVMPWFFHIYQYKFKNK